MSAIGRGRLLRPERITRAMVRASPRTIWVFGDNLERRGYGGQAREMRGEPNAIGVPTKRKPERGPDAYLSDAMWERDSALFVAVAGAFNAMKDALAEGRDVAIPADGLGTGLAELPTRAPRMAAWIERRIAELGAVAEKP